MVTWVGGGKYHSSGWRRLTMSLVRTSFVIAAVAAGFGLTAAPASAEIVVNRSVAGVGLGMSQEKVVDLLGDPDSTVTNPAFDTTYTYRSRGLRVIFAPNGDTNDVTTITIHRRAERTASGVGVGSSYSEMRAGVSGERCVRAPNRKHRWCSVQTSRRHTTFVVSSTKRVLEIVFGYRGDA